MKDVSSPSVNSSCLDSALVFTAELQRFCWIPWSGNSFPLLLAAGQDSQWTVT